MLSGCDVPPPANTQNSSEALPLTQKVARAVLAAGAYERGLRALRTGDANTTEAAQRELNRLGATPPRVNLTLRAAWNELRDAEFLDVQSRSFSGAQRSELRRRADAKYRRVLELAPDFDSPSARDLNSLGYFLAERGTTADDFLKAETLTRRAVKLLDQQIAEVKSGKASNADALTALRYMRAQTRDSLAWALHRQGRFREALSEQLVAMREESEVVDAAGARLSPELQYHLGEMHAGLKDEKLAIAAFERALKLDASDSETHEQVRRALSRLKSKTP
jgi:tetratricopeptide (TPR) repeat protein